MIRRCDIDLSDAQWARIEPLLARPGGQWGRSPKHARRTMLDAMLYQLRTGCQWRLLPREFPPWNRVWELFWRWRKGGVLRRVHRKLRDECRRAGGRHEAPPGGHSGQPERQNRR